MKPLFSRGLEHGHDMTPVVQARHPTSEAEPSRLRPENLAELTNDQFDEVSCGRAALGTTCASPSGPQGVFSTEHFYRKR